jgi:2-alkenal reductase
MRNLLFIGSILGLLLACNISVGMSQVSLIPVTGISDEPPSNGRAQGIAWPAPISGPPPAASTIDGEEQRLIALFERVNPSVVHIHTDRPRPGTGESLFVAPMRRGRGVAGFFGEISDPNGGSGFVLDNDRHILTTNRVVAGARQIQVTFADGTATSATVVGADRNTDLAVLEARELPVSAKPLELGNPDSLQVGQSVLALGNPLGYGGVMTSGIVSAKARNVTLELEIDRGFFTAPDLIQTDATIIPGATGGALINLDGQVVGVLGIDTLAFDAAGGTAAGGVGFSIPTSTIQRVVPVLLEEGRYRYPWLGVSAPSGSMDPDWTQAMGLPPDQRGVLILKVTPGSPAAKAGLRGGDRQVPGLEPGLQVGGDIITAFQGQPVTTFSELVSLLFRQGTVGETVTLTIIRDGKEMLIPMTLEERP